MKINKNPCVENGTRLDRHTNPEDWKEFIEYGKRDIVSMREIYHALPIKDLSANERKVWELDSKINHTGIPIDVKLVSTCAKMTEKIVEKESKRFRDTFGFNVTQIAKLKTFLQEQGININDTQKATLEALTDITPTAQMAVDMRLSLNKAATKKFKTMLLAAIDGRIYGVYSFIFANSGRWSSKIVNTQNMIRATGNAEETEEDIYNGKILEYVKPLEALSSVLRHCIYSPNGLGVTDLSQIEVRMGYWLAGAEDVLDSFRRGEDLYKFMASKIYGIPIEEVTKDQRFIAKTGSLALIFQGGINSLIKMSKTFGANISDEQAEEIKTDWRESNRPIVDLWKELDETAKTAVVTGIIQTVGHLKFGMLGNHLYMQLPSKRRIYFPDAKVQNHIVPAGKTYNSFQTQVITYYGHIKGTAWGRRHIYGGKLLNYATQGASRDILAYAMVRLDEAGHDIIGHTHDETITFGPDRMKEVDEIFTMVPDWAKGLPLDAESSWGNHYGK